MTIRAIAFFWKNFAIVRTVITQIRPDTDIRSQNIRSVIFTSVTIHDFLFFWCKIVFFIHTITIRSQSMYSKRLVLPLKTYPHLFSISTSVIGRIASLPKEIILTKLSYRTHFVSGILSHVYKIKIPRREKAFVAN